MYTLIYPAAATAVFQQWSELVFIHLQISDYEITVGQALNRQKPLQIHLTNVSPLPFPHSVCVPEEFLNN